MTSKFQRDLRKALGDIEKAYEKTISPKEMRSIGKEAVLMIQIRTRLGYGVSRNTKARETTSANMKRKKLTPLSPAYIKMRRRLAKQGMLDGTTRPAKSNLTKTGQMIKNLKVDRVQKGKVILKTKGRRRDGYDNEQIAEWVSLQGRPWLDLTGTEQKKLARYYQNNILKPAMAKV